MNRYEVQDRIDELEDLISTETDPTRKAALQKMKDDYEVQLRELDMDSNNRTKGQKIGAGLGRLSGMVVGLVAGELESCVTGKDIKKTRGKYADGGESIGSAIGGIAERLIDARRRRK